MQVLHGQTLTPDKSFLEVKLSRGGGSKAVKLINRKGTFSYSLTCADCKFSGKVNASLGYHIEPTCDRDMEERGTWRKYSSMSLKEHKKCKMFQPKEALKQ